MKISCKQFLISILLTLLSVCLIFSGILMSTEKTTYAADSGPTTITLTANPSTIPYNAGTFTIDIKIETTRTGYLWGGINFYLSPLTDDGIVDTTVASYLSYEDSTITFDDGFKTFYTDSTTDYFDSSTNAGVRIATSNMNVTKGIDCSTVLNFRVPIKINENIRTENLDHINLGIRSTKANSIGFLKAGATAVTDNASTTIVVNNTRLGIKIPSSDATLSGLEAGFGTDLQPITPTDNMTFTVTDPNLNNFNIRPTANDGATITIVNGTTTKPAPSGEITNVPLTGGRNEIKINMTAEDGTTKTYTLIVTMGIARLGALTVTPGTAHTDATKKGLDGAFDSEKFEYDAFIPRDRLSAKVQGAILTGYGVSNSIRVKVSGCSVVGATTVTSGNTININNITEGSTVTLTATAADGVTTKDYVVTFRLVNVNTAIDSLTAKGTSGTIYNNDSVKATENSVNYYFALDTETVFEASFVLTLSDPAASAQINGEAYSANKMYELETYTLTVTAEAGNKTEYKVMLTGPLALEINETAKMQFLMEEQVEEDGDTYFYRRTYAEKNWTHGIDDKDLERFVVGQIVPETSIQDFVSGFVQSQIPMIRLYDKDGTLLYNRGNPGDGLTESDLTDTEMYQITTGMYIEFGAGDTPLETIYCSVLGDVNGDGYVDTSDNITILSYIRRVLELNEVEYRLSAYITNNGNIDTSQAIEVLTIIRRIHSVEDHFYKPESN